MKKLFLLLIMVATFSVALAQTRTVTGTVTYAEDGEPLMGATVMPIGGGNGAATNVDGEFSIKVPANVHKIRVSYIGMHTQEVEITGKPMKIALTNATNNLDDVIVVAYGTAKKSAYTGSASVVKAEDLEQAMVTNAVNALKGEVAGVQILSSNGQPGSAPSVLIRGVGSINASTEPLYVLDGMPIDAGDVPQLNTMDIESMTVLKDAAAAALYGARGANGVILITTKKGKEGQAQITFDARWGANSRQIQNYDKVNSTAKTYEMAYMALRNGYTYHGEQGLMAAHAAANNKLMTDAFGANTNVWTVPEGQALVGVNGRLNPNATLGRSDGANFYTVDNWQDGTYRNGLRQEYSLSVSGGTDRFDYYVSGAYLGDEGIIIGSNFNRLSSRVAMNYQAKKWLKIGTNLSYNYTKSGYPDDQTDGNSPNNAFAIANKMAPVYPMYIRHANGNIMMDASTGYPVYDYGDGVYSMLVRQYMNKANPVSELIYNTSDYLMDIFNGKWYATLTPVTNLNITGTIGYYLDNTRYHGVSNNLYGQMKEYGGQAYQSQSRARSINTQVLATYRHTIAEKNNLDYLVGYESFDYNSEGVSAWGNNLYQPGVWAVANTLNDIRRKGSGSSSSYATRGILARVNYDYDGRYYFSASYRRDASSRFAPDKRWGNFFSVSAGWDIAKESFMRDFTNVDMIKVKASFGQQGNDGIGNNYAYLDQYQISGTDSWSDGTLAYKGNPNLTWETSNNFNAGFDFSFFKGRIDGTIEYFQRQTSDMLYNRPVAPSNGYQSIPVNVGSMRNYGAEIELRVQPIVTRNLTWEINLNGTFVKNKILKLAPELKGRLVSNVRVLEEGSSMYQYTMPEYAGVNHENGAPMWYALVDNTDMPIEWKTDENGDFVLNENGERIAAKWAKKEIATENYDLANSTNRKDTGNTMPTFYGGFGTTLRAYGFDFSIGFSYQLGGRVLDYSYGDLMHSGGDLGTAWHADMLRAWTPENPNTDIPKLDAQNPYTLGGSMSTFLLTSSDYLSLNNITLGYTIPNKLTRRIGIEQIRVYGAADNVALWAKRKGLDPRNGFLGLDSNMTYSAVRNISGGLRVVF